jgi:hypothetical protein
MKCSEIPAEIKAKALGAAADISLTSRIESMQEDIDANPVPTKSSRLDTIVFKKAGHARKENDKKILQLKVSIFSICSNVI